jgi:hypothetical protein
MTDTTTPDDADQGYLLVGDEATPIPDWLWNLACHLINSEGHDDPLVRATRKIVAQAGLALEQALDQTTASLPTSASDETPTHSREEETPPPDDVDTSMVSAPPSEAEPSSGVRMLYDAAHQETAA